MTSAVAMATVPLANQAQLLMISPTVTTNELSSLDDYFVRIVPATRQFVRTSVDYYVHSLGLQRIRAIYDLRNRSYTESWLNDISTLFSKAGGKMLPPLSFTSSDEVEFSTLARQALEENPDGIIIAGNSVDTAILCQNIRKQNPSIPIGTSEWASTGRLIELGGRWVEGVAVEQFFNLQSTQAAYVTFRDAYIQRFGQSPAFGGLYSFDAANILFDVMAGKKPDQSLKHALLTKRTFSGTQKNIVFNATGDSQGETYLFVVKDGAFVPAHPK